MGLVPNRHVKEAIKAAQKCKERFGLVDMVGADEVCVFDFLVCLELIRRMRNWRKKVEWNHGRYLYVYVEIEEPLLVEKVLFLDGGGSGCSVWFWAEAGNFGHEGAWLSLLLLLHDPEASGWSPRLLPFSRPPPLSRREAQNLD
jgi:hypothetical protein